MKGLWGRQLAFVVSCFSISGCISDYGFGSLPASQKQNSASPTSIGDHYVCDPFGAGGTGANSKNGLLASLTYLPAAIAKTQNLTVASFQIGAPNVVLEPTPIVLSELNRSTVDFTQGFVDPKGASVNDLQGNLLTEYFALHIQAGLKIDSNDAQHTDGNYQLAVLSDDGSILNVDLSGQALHFSPLINNDGVHSNRIACSADSAPVYVSHAHPISLSLDYYQGPRVRIALMMFWRKVGANTAPDPFCGKTDTSDSFFYNGNPPVATQNMSDFLARGWEVIPASAFVLPGNLDNPCF